MVLWGDLNIFFVSLWNVDVCGVHVCEASARNVSTVAVEIQYCGAAVRWQCMKPSHPTCRFAALLSLCDCQESFHAGASSRRTNGPLALF